MSTYLDSDTDALELDADAPRPVKYRELGVVASDDALDIGIHPISLRSKITPADTFSDRPDATLANPCTAPLPSSHVDPQFSPKKEDARACSSVSTTPVRTL